MHKIVVLSKQLLQHKNRDCYKCRPLLLNMAQPAPSLTRSTLKFGRLFAQLWIAAVVDYLGNHAFITVMKYVPALMIATAELFGPMIASSEAVIFGVETLPGPWTVAGAIIIGLGGLLIAWQAHKQSTTVELGYQ